MPRLAWNRGLLCVILLTGLVYAQKWNGNVCKRVVCVYVNKRVCTYKTWLGCCAYKTIRQPVTSIEKFCCDGWRHNGNRRCDIPVCEPGCMNGGTCTNPGKCTCLKQYTGPRCGQARCSHVDPCYPGTCRPASTDCECTAGFKDAGRARDKHCLSFAKKPEVFHIQANLSFWDTMKGMYMEMYSLLSDSSDKKHADFIWTNRERFNRLVFDASGQFSVSKLSPKPGYVSDSGFGIVEASARILHTKNLLPDSVNRRRRSRRNAGARHTSRNDTLHCDPKLSSRQPNASLFQCHLTPRLDTSLETGDILTITFSAKSGGFRELRDQNTGRVVNTQEFEGQVVESSVEFRFDLEAPYHCRDVHTCNGGERPLSVKDLTKTPLDIGWGGWLDSLSGMHRYALEVFPLNKTLDRSLRILEPLKPIFSREVMHSDLHRSTPVTYTPPSTGMYAVILEAADLANNTRFIRRLTLYDPGSEVTLEPVDSDAVPHFRFSSASPAAGFSYQNDTQREIVVTWKEAFRNELHERLGLLGQVEPYPPQLENSRKTIPPEADDREGERNVTAINNRRGIVNFELAYQKLSIVGRAESLPSNPPDSVDWNPMGLDETYVVPDRVNDGDTVIAWVRATDVMGSQLVRRTEVTIDQTKAEVGQLEFKMNQQVQGIPFSSIFVLDAKDMESGIAQVKWTFTRSNGTVIYTDTVLGHLAQTCGSGDFRTCYCTPRAKCYLLDQSYSLSNCHMMVEKENLATEVIHVHVEVINAAGLVTSRTMEKGQLTMLNGTESYYPPQNVRVLSLTETGARVTWDFPPSCYKRTELWIVIPDSSGKEEIMTPVHKDADHYDVTGLLPDKDYNIQLIAHYSGPVKSDPKAFTFRTAEKAGLTGGESAGVVIGVLLLLLLLAVMVMALMLIVRRRDGRDPPSWLQGPRFQNWWNSASGRAVHEEPKEAVSYLNKKQSEPDHEDLYLTAGQAWQEPPPAWQVKASNLVLQNQIAVGKFADVYRATWTASAQNDKKITVAAKILKPEFSTDDASKMMKKIEFFASKVGKHNNVLLFQGAVLDNEHLGPVMMLEFCEMGQLDKWLAGAGAGSKGSNGSDGLHPVISEDTVDKLFGFARDISCGMEYLSSLGIVHSRLAARNVLLTFLLDVKVAGFGPAEVAGGRVPAKWAAPEVLEDKPATEKSDVWAFGVTLWEIFSMGKTPYSDVRGTEIGPFLKSGKRLDKPELADAVFYTLMCNCWKEKPSARPCFKEIKQQLCALFTGPSRNSCDFYYEASQLRK